MFLSPLSLGCVNRTYSFLFQKRSKSVCTKGKEAAGVLCGEMVSGRHMMAAGICQFLLRTWDFFLCHYFVAIITEPNSDCSATLLDKHQHIALSPYDELSFFPPSCRDVKGMLFHTRFYFMIRATSYDGLNLSPTCLPKYVSVPVPWFLSLLAKQHYHCL